MHGAASRVNRELSLNQYQAVVSVNALYKRGSTRCTGHVANTMTTYPREFISKKLPGPLVYWLNDVLRYYRANGQLGVNQELEQEKSNQIQLANNYI